MNELLKLAKRCEKAAAADRLLDAQIVVATDWRRGGWINAAGKLWVYRGPTGPEVLLNSLGRRSRGDPSIGDYPKFTASIDAALTLVPGPYAWEVGQRVTLDCEAIVYGHEMHQSGDAATPALALCAAALKARDAA